MKPLLALLCSLNTISPCCALQAPYIFARIKLHARGGEDVIYTVIGYAILSIVISLISISFRFAFRKFFVDVPSATAIRRKAMCWRFFRIVVVVVLVVGVGVTAYVGSNWKRWRLEVEEREYEKKQQELKALRLSDDEVARMLRDEAEREERYKDTILDEIPEPNGADRFFEKDWRDKRNAEIRQHNAEARRRRAEREKNQDGDYRL